MWEHSVKMPARWLTRKEALDYLGISEARFKALLAAALIRTHGNGNGERFEAESVWAVSVLWDRLEKLLAGETPEEAE